MAKSSICFYDQEEDLTYNTECEEGEVIPDMCLPKAAEDINSTKELLETIAFIKEHRLYKINECYLNLIKAETAIQNIDKLIGMDKIKEMVVHQILSLTKPTMIKDGFINTAIYGSPGSGKTTLARLLGEIYKKFSIAKTGQFVTADRASLI